MPETTDDTTEALKADITRLYQMSIDLTNEKEGLRAALAQCSAGFVIKRADQTEIDYEALAREFCRRMKLAKDALE